MVKKLYSFFDKLEDKIRIRLSHRPVLYALIGAVGVILVWKGVWETAEFFPVLHGPMSVLLGVLILLLTGLFVSFFIGDSIIISGFKHEKKLVEKTEEEIRIESQAMQKVLTKLDTIEDKVEDIEATLEK
jgi:hypothetical protein